MNEDQEREQFEQAAHAHYLAERSKRAIPGDFDQPTTVEGLMWRQPSGEYGVLIYNAAWWAWKTRAVLVPVRVLAPHAALRFTILDTMQPARGPEETDDAFKARLKSYITPARPQHYDDLTGTDCAECKEQQFMTPSGITCPNGHGGAESL